MTRPATSTIHCDLEGRITFVSEGAEEVFGYPASELVDVDRVSFFSPGLVVLEHVPRWLKTSVAAGHFETDTVFIRKDGSHFAAHIRITPIVKDGDHTGYVGLTTSLDRQPVLDAMPAISPITRLASWLFIVRAPFLSVTIVAVLIGALAAPLLAPGTNLNLGLLLVTLLGASLAHLGANTTNDYFDWRSGVDDRNNDYVAPYSGGSWMIQLGVISPSTMLKVSVSLYALAAGIALYLVAAVGIAPQLLALALAGAAIGVLYSAPPVRLASRGIGELSIALAFGLLLVAGSTLVQTGTFESRALLAGIPTGLLTACIIWVNQFPDAVSDAAGGKRTLVVRLNLAKSRFVYVALWVLSELALAALVISKVLPIQALLALASVPMGAYLTVLLFQRYRSRDIKAVMAGTINLHLASGALTCLGLWLAI